MGKGVGMGTESDSGMDADSGGAARADASVDSPRYAAPCTVSAASVVCEHQIAQLPDGSGMRNVYWAAPIGPEPRAGFPLAIIFQGSLFGPSYTWQELTPDVPFGGFYQGLLHVSLLEAGFVVVAPEAEGGLAWQTNAGGDYESSSDHLLMQELFRRFAETEDFGHVDGARIYATGISSGGYMTSRMAVSYPGRTSALAIQSGSYATCLGPLCSVPATLPSDHPPTLFLHGDADTTVPIATAIAYHDVLEAQGVETELIVGMGIGHAWLQSAPQDITAWFLSH
jgi:predicted esterase